VTLLSVIGLSSNASSTVANGVSGANIAGGIITTRLSLATG
jgi:hypothetical protein